MDSNAPNATPAATLETATADSTSTPPSNIFSIPHGRASPSLGPSTTSTGADAGSRPADDEDDDVDLFEEETFMHRGLGASPSSSKKLSHPTETDGDGNRASASGDRNDGDALATPIAAHNPGYQLLLKLGWTAGKGLGATESGRVDPIPHYTHVGTTGLGQWQKDLEYLSLATARPVSLAERLATETDADREKREAKVQRDEATKAEVDAVKRALYRCDICNKQYNKQHELDSHLGSYEHHHAKRAKEMRDAERKLAKEGGDVEREKKRAKRREEKEMEMMVKAAAAAAHGGNASVRLGAAAVAAPAAAVVPAPLSASPSVPQHVQQHQQQHYAAHYAAYYAQHYGQQYAGYPPLAVPGTSYASPPQHQHLAQQPSTFPQAPPMSHIVPPAMSTELSATSQPPSDTTSVQAIPTSFSAAAPVAASSLSSTAPRPAISFGLGRKFKK